VYLQDNVMQVEYLQEYESTFLNFSEQDKIPIQKNQIKINTSSHSDSNNCDMLLLQKRKAVINNESSSEKENINEIMKK